jgi:hypothetical protein
MKGYLDKVNHMSQRTVNQYFTFGSAHGGFTKIVMKLLKILKRSMADLHTKLRSVKFSGKRDMDFSHQYSKQDILFISLFRILNFTSFCVLQECIDTIFYIAI